MLNAHSVIFVHGLGGHPRHTWEYFDGHPTSKRSQFWPFKPRSKTEAAPASDGGPRGSSGSEGIFWPSDKLPLDVPNATVWTYGYDANVIPNFFQPGNVNSILQHSDDLMVKIERKLENKVRVS
jgi:hypothetical protein